MPAAQVAPSALPPEEPTVPFEYLIRLETTISKPDYLTPRDGTRYRLQPTSLTIARPNTQASSEPVLEYALG
jgi:hypothetical protein